MNSAEILEEFMMRKLGASPDETPTDSLGRTYQLCWLSNEPTVEDFKLSVGKPVSDQEIDDIIVMYYKGKGYSIEEKKSITDNLYYMKARNGEYGEHGLLSINISNFGTKIAVTVSHSLLLSS